MPPLPSTATTSVNVPPTSALIRSGPLMFTYAGLGAADGADGGMMLERIR
jgi:hypothetical protein